MPFQKVTETETFRSVNIIEFHNGEYEVCHKISQNNIDEMSENMSPEDQVAFREYLNTYFSGVDVVDPNAMPTGGRRIIVE